MVSPKTPPQNVDVSGTHLRIIPFCMSNISCEFISVPFTSVLLLFLIVTRIHTRITTIITTNNSTSTTPIPAPIVMMAVAEIGGFVLDGITDVEVEMREEMEV